MANNFQEWQGDWENKEEHQEVLNEIERNLLHQAHTLSHFGRVIELFVPNALQTAAHLIAGAKQSGPHRPPKGRYSSPIIPEGRPPSSGGGANSERLLPSDKETI
ncbi:MAG: hypothetical protein KF734_20510 [Saprospiraceae bacterium]|nr:hypothetical protein [Saprospiraceae bacterium]MCW5922685.1 hypothetical protein [Saprospiraceae bacterium]